MTSTPPISTTMLGNILYFNNMIDIWPHLILWPLWHINRQGTLCFRWSPCLPHLTLWPLWDACHPYQLPRDSCLSNDHLAFLIWHYSHSEMCATHINYQGTPVFPMITLLTSFDTIATLRCVPPISTAKALCVSKMWSISLLILSGIGGKTKPFWISISMSMFFRNLVIRGIACPSP